VTRPFYFAYGANMSADVLARRMRRDSVAFQRRRAVLADHRLVFDKVSSTDPAVGYANVLPATGHRVEGILNEFDEHGLAQLDAIELVPHHYRRLQMTVRDDNGLMVSAHVYMANTPWIRQGLRPLRSYLEIMLAGADLLSPDYVASLRSVRCQDDAPPKSY
jgi:gamma-glutamylcyclotransferase